MQCDDIRELIDRFGALDERQRAAVYEHVAGCPACRRHLESESPLAEALAALSNPDLAVGKARLKARLAARSNQLIGQAGWALAGTLVAAGAAILFMVDGDPFGKFALTGTALVMMGVAWRSRWEARELAEVGGNDAGMRAWRAQLAKERRQIIAGGPLVTGLFAVMTLIVIFRFGAGDLRSVIFGLTCAGITGYTVRQLVVRRPVVERELSLLEALEP